MEASKYNIRVIKLKKPLFWLVLHLDYEPPQTTTANNRGSQFTFGIEIRIKITTSRILFDEFSCIYMDKRVHI